MKSIRFYLVVALLSTIMLGNFIAAIHGYRTSMEEAQALLDIQLADTATMIQTMQPTSSRLADQPSSRLAFQIWDAGGDLIQRSANSSETPITRFEEGYRDENFEGFRWRVLGKFDEQRQRWILVAERIDIRTELADNIILRAVTPIVLSLPVIAAIVWLVVGNGLSLIKKLARELRTKRADDLSRLSTTNPPIELAPVVDAINGLLRRLHDAVQRERSFSADAAHELRTPLSAIKVHIHNLRKECPENATVLQTLDRDVARLSHLIEQIMLLYSTTPEDYQADMLTIDLHALAQSVIGELYEEIDGKRQTISLVGESQMIVGDETSIVILLRNLILNASKYSPEGASIQVNLDREEFGVRLGVSDTGPGIPLSDIGRIFDRFYRVGGDRHTSSVDGCGLGLSIVKHIADLHHADVDVSNNADGQGLLVSIVFPFDIDTSMVVGGQSI